MLVNFVFENKPDWPIGWFVIVNLFNNIALRNQKFTKSSESDPMFEVSGLRAYDHQEHQFTNAICTN